LSLKSRKPTTIKERIAGLDKFPVTIAVFPAGIVISSPAVGTPAGNQFAAMLQFPVVAKNVFEIAKEFFEEMARNNNRKMV
jgi:hypothetical protein